MNNSTTKALVLILYSVGLVFYFISFSLMEDATLMTYLEKFSTAHSAELIGNLCLFAATIGAMKVFVEDNNK